jgi:alkane 1-monooxygenase
MPAKFALPFVFLAAVVAAARSGVIAMAMVLPALVLAFISLDAMLGVSPIARPTETRAIAHRCLIWSYIPAQLAAIAWSAATAGAMPGIVDVAVLGLAIGATSGIFGMLAAHEMIHARRPLERALGLAMLAAVGYMHFRISHLYGHHRLGATMADPATARRGESAYRFLGRSIIGQWRDAWRHEQRRAARRRWPVLANRLHQYILVEAALTLGVAALLGGKSLFFLSLQALVAVLILELFNYVAHYGLRRRVLPGGGVEPLGPLHSWNAAHQFNNWALFNGGQHSDHHRAPRLAYQRLRVVAETPMLPYGYAGSILLALVPPLWRRVMDPRAMAWRALSLFPNAATRPLPPGAATRRLRFGRAA